MTEEEKMKLFKLEEDIMDGWYLYKAYQKEYEELWAKIYDDCSHFRVICNVSYDGIELKKYVDYKCIKCGLDERYLNYPYIECDFNAMVPYLKNHGGRIDGFSTSTSITAREAEELYKKVIESNPNITNEDFEQILIEREKEKNRKEVEEKEKQRIRELNKPRSIWDWPL